MFYDIVDKWMPKWQSPFLWEKAESICLSLSGLTAGRLTGYTWNAGFWFYTLKFYVDLINNKYNQKYFS